DKYGSRGVMTRIVLWWSAFTVLTGCVMKFSLDSGVRLTVPGTDWQVPLLIDSFVMLLIIRFLFGAGEAGALPNAARVVTRWFPPDRRGPAQGLINTSMLIGGAFVPTVTAELIEVEWIGWRGVFFLYGSLGILWAAAFYWWFVDNPAENPAVNEAELRLIGERSSSAAHEPIPWRLVLTSPNVWLLGGVITCSAFSSYLYYFWYPKYLQAARGVSQVDSGRLTSLVLVLGAIGGTVGGYVADWSRRRTGERRWCRRAAGSTGLMFAAVALAASVMCDWPIAVALCTGLAAFCAMMTISTWWAVVSEISGKHLGALFGLMNSMGVIGAGGSQLFFGSFADWMEGRGYTGRAQWDPGFYVICCVLLVGAVGWLLVDPTVSVVEPREAASPQGSD
ncbi:MAG TPA: MFS transporter, partial [Gemmataceae bacterium]|nr:MFS transporter [Gemmataceae bacterium]